MRLAVLGMAVGHSRSPRIHRAALAACGLAGEYVAREVDAIGFAGACEEIAAGELDGANVTMPHKRAAHDACRLLDPDAVRAEAVNTLARRDGILAGWNTDVAALRRALESLPEEEVLLLGAGGAAAAVLVAGAARQVTVAARSEATAKKLVDRVHADARVVPWGTAVPGAIVVNATPLGMKGEPLPAGVLEAAAGLVDLAYGEAPTPAVRWARSRGLPAIDGISILVAQAAESFEIWTGLSAPRAVMEQAARRPEKLKTP